MSASAATGWTAFNQALATARDELLAVAPDFTTAAEAESYLLRVATATLNDAFLGHLFTHEGLTRALPTRGAPNPDYLMYHAAVDPTLRYRLTGKLYDSERAGIGLYSITTEGATQLAGYTTFNRGNVATDGSFAIDIAKEATGAGALSLTPSCRVLLVRILHRHVQGRACALTLTGGKARGLLPPMGDHERALAQAGNATLRAVKQFIEWTRTTSTMPNCFIEPPSAMSQEVRSDPDTTYGLGYYDLAEGDWLEASIPAGLKDYWSLHAYNHWCESLPGAGAHDRNAVPDADGRIRVRIGPTLPTPLLNRMDTQGRRRGVLVFRACGATAAQIPSAVVRRS